MNENDLVFIEEVVDFYYSTIDDEHPNGNMSEVAEEYKITRAKVNKILITAGVIDSPLHQDIIGLKEEGYDVGDIAKALGVSEATVKINLPYEKVIYNGTEKSSGAVYVEKFRDREKVFLDKVVRKPTDLELIREAYYSDPYNVMMSKYFEDQGMIPKHEKEDDTIHLSPAFTEEESKLFHFDHEVVALHIELDADLTEVKEYAGIKYGHTISRDLLVPDNMPLHNLHYAINQAFGFTNSHLHEYTLPPDELEWVTDDKTENWKKLIGLVFKNPIRDENVDFWDDDYEGGSPKKWMRSKYTGPFEKIYEEGYRFIREQVDDMEVDNEKLPEMGKDFFLNPFALNEAVPVSEILECYDEEGYRDLEEYYAYVDESIENAKKFEDTDQRSQPFVYAFASKLIYSYDFGDSWHFTITPKRDMSYLVDDGRISLAELKAAIKNVNILCRPTLLAFDGCPLVEDVGGSDGFIDFIKAIKEDRYDKKELLKWAKSQGWNEKVTKGIL